MVLDELFAHQVMQDDPGQDEPLQSEQRFSGPSVPEREIEQARGRSGREKATREMHGVFRHENVEGRRSGCQQHTPGDQQGGGAGLGVTHRECKRWSGGLFEVRHRDHIAVVLIVSVEGGLPAPCYGWTVCALFAFT